MPKFRTIYPNRSPDTQGQTYIYRDRTGLAYIVQALSLRHAKSTLLLKTSLTKEQISTPQALKLAQPKAQGAYDLAWVSKINYFLFLSQL